MSPQRQEKNLKIFLETETNLYQTTFSRVARLQFADISRHVENAGTLDDYILMHEKEIKEKPKTLSMKCVKR